MANSSTRRNKAEIQYAEKLKLERKFRQRVSKTLNDLSKDIAAAYAEAGETFNAELYYPEFERILFEHYVYVADRFGSSLTDDLTVDEAAIGAVAIIAATRGTSSAAVVEAFKRDKDAGIIRFIKQTVPVRAAEITRTNIKAANSAVAAAQAGMAGANQLAVGKAAGRSFKASNIYRASTIAATETQTAAEGTKLVEAELFGEAISESPISNAVVKKEWQTMGDDLVRPEHAAANGQVQLVDDPYVVGGEEMMTSGDDSLGASAGNVINCRCASITFVE